ncbi:MAG: hypothetical protein RQ853_05100 [Acidianus sp.]|nr:hypothetical protein [Acidianus sp.]
MSPRALPLLAVLILLALAVAPQASAQCLICYPMISNASYTLFSYAVLNNYNAYFMKLPQGATAMISPMLWNLVGGNGNVTMVLSEGHLAVYVNITGVVRAISFTPVVGFPDIMYGDYSWGPFYTMTSTYSFLRLPMPTGQVPSLWSIVNYSLSLREGSYNDFSYDIWLVRHPGATSLGPSDVELMLWMYANQSLAGLPYWVTWHSVTMPTIIDGQLENLSYQVFILPRNGGPSGWMLIILIPELNYSEGAYHGLTRGVFGVNLRDLISTAVNIVGEFNGTQWESGLYLSVIQLGAEVDASGNGTMLMNFTVYSWDLCGNLSATQTYTVTQTVTRTVTSALTSVSTTTLTSTVNRTLYSTVTEVVKEVLLTPIIVAAAVAVIAVAAAAALTVRTRRG